MAPLWVLLALPAVPSHAQEAAVSAPLEQITITGSHLLRTDAETPSPVQTITAEQIRRSGLATIADVLHNVTANNMGSLSQAAPQSSAAGGAGIALRGLTVGDTLVLIDGHRMAPYPLPDDGTRNFVDIASIPLDAVEKIEILKDGASSVYGSDAIAGVVNVILKRSVTGTQVGIEGGGSSAGDAQNARISLSSGWGQLESDGHTIFVAVEASHQGSVPLSSRSYLATTDWRPYGGVNLAQGTASGAPSGASSGGGSGTGFLTNAQGSPVAYFPGCNASAAVSGGCGYSNPYMTLQPETRHLDLLGGTTFLLPEDWQLDFKGSALRSESRQAGLYNNAFTTGVGTGGNGGGAALFRFGPGVGPFPATSSAFPFFLTVPAGYPDNPLGAPARLVYDFPDLGPQTQDVVSTSYRGVAAVEGGWGVWKLNAALGLTRVSTEAEFLNYLDFPAVQDALNTGSYLIGGANSANLVATLAPPASAHSGSALSFITLAGSRELYTLEGGALSLGLGAEFTHRSLAESFPSSFGNGTQNLAIYSFAEGQQNVSAGWFELAAPVTRGLEIDASGRLDHYDAVGAAATPKLGVKFSPLREFTLRGTYSQGFRAPTPAENGTAGSTAGYVGGFYDPLKCPGGSGANPAADAGCSVVVKELQLAAAHLDPERSQSWTLGMILAPTPQLSATLDFYRITIRDQIISTGELGQASLNNAAALGTRLYRDASGDLIYVSNTFINANTTTTSGVDIELRGGLGLGDELGRLDAQAQFTYLLNYDLTAQGVTYHLAGTHGPSYVSEDTGTPRGRGTLGLTWTRGSVELSGTLNYVSAFGVTDPSAGIDTCAAALASEFPNGRPPSQFCTVGSFTALDMALAYRIDEGLGVYLDVTNLLNRHAPYDLQTFGAAGNGAQQGGAAYNPSLHQEGALGLMLRAGVHWRI